MHNMHTFQEISNNLCMVKLLILNLRGLIKSPWFTMPVSLGPYAESTIGWNNCNDVNSFHMSVTMPLLSIKDLRLLFSTRAGPAEDDPPLYKKRDWNQSRLFGGSVGGDNNYENSLMQASFPLTLAHYFILFMNTKCAFLCTSYWQIQYSSSDGIT